MLIIFDCDGVLVDSESLSARVFSAHLANFGVSLSAQQCEHKFRGHTMDHCLAMLQNEYPGSLPHDFLGGLAAATTETFNKNLQPVAGIEPVLQWLSSRGTPFCVASNGALSKVYHSLAVTGLRDYFGDHCFSAEQVTQGKPAPDLFLLAAKSMGCLPGKTLVVEDSLTGVTAAIKAGMAVLRYGSPLEVNGGVIEGFVEMAILPDLIEEFSLSLRDG